MAVTIETFTGLREKFPVSYCHWMARNVVTTFQTATAAFSMILVNTILNVLGLLFAPLFLCCSSEGFQAPYSLLSEEFNDSFLESSLTFQH